jgi:hypothetical protein
VQGDRRRGARRRRHEGGALPGALRVAGYPGETYRIKYWKDGDKRILLEAESVERNVKMITNAVVELR